jgi:hypothetical protein
VKEEDDDRAEIFTPAIYTGYYVFISRLLSVNRVSPSVGAPTPELFSAKRITEVVVLNPNKVGGQQSRGTHVSSGIL